MTLNVDKKNVLKAWREADNKGKQMLENLYGKEIFANQNVMDRIKTFEDAMEETGRKGVPDFQIYPKTCAGISLRYIKWKLLRKL